MRAPVGIVVLCLCSVHLKTRGPLIGHSLNDMFLDLSVFCFVAVRQEQSSYSLLFKNYVVNTMKIKTKWKLLIGNQFIYTFILPFFWSSDNGRTLLPFHAYAKLWIILTKITSIQLALDKMLNMYT